MNEKEQINKVYLGLGSNIGDRASILKNAEALISMNIGKIVLSSSTYETKPEGFDSDNLFFNKVVCVETYLSAIEVLHASQKIERSLGRLNKSVNGQYSDRTIDIDILFYNLAQITSDELIVPHPWLHLREFVVVPLSEIAPLLKHPVLSVSIKTLRSRLLG